MSGIVVLATFVLVKTNLDPRAFISRKRCKSDQLIYKKIQRTMGSRLSEQLILKTYFLHIFFLYESRISNIGFLGVAELYSF